MFISVSDYPHDSLVRGYTYGPRSRSCDIDAEALQVWASVTDPGGSGRQVCFLKPVSLKSRQLHLRNCLSFLNMPFPGMDGSWNWKS